MSVFEIPNPLPGERPTAYADRAGRWYAKKVSAVHKKEYGQYLTPAPLADFMASHLAPDKANVRILDPGAGAGVLACAVAEHFARSPKRKVRRLLIQAYETDADLAAVLKSSLNFLSSVLGQEGLVIEARVVTEDFILSNAGILGTVATLFHTPEGSARFDAVISNPPYFKLPKSDPRARAAAEIVHGQPNIYALFMAVSAQLLESQGQFVFITPRSFASGPYFRRFRQHFFETMRPEKVHIFESRRQAFDRDNILQENIIIVARRVDGWSLREENANVSVSSSEGFRDLGKIRPRIVPLDSILDLRVAGNVLRVPTTEADEQAQRLVRSWSGSLHAFGMEISTGPVVPFRCREFLASTGRIGITHAPLLWMQHVHSMSVRWPALRLKKPQYILRAENALPLLRPDKTYVLLRRFSAKEERRRLTAAPLIRGTLGSPWLGIENHLNYIYRPGGELTEDEAWGLAALYSSELMDRYFRILNGSTQVSATELRSMPLPPLSVIKRLGQKVRQLSTIANDQLDALVKALLPETQPDERKVVALG
ncbi:MAG: Eco57I restriction-modification methylase domain-containing protein [Planctomycetota bacterium]|nr:Eco57I restriction-modification methylase domain-containing protein [Planctomycetota bacterium]